MRDAAASGAITLLRAGRRIGGTRRFAGTAGGAVDVTMLLPAATRRAVLRTSAYALRVIVRLDSGAVASGTFRVTRTRSPRAR